jgi:hypothetical protein
MSASLEEELLSRWQDWFGENPPPGLELLAVGRKYRDCYTLLPFPTGSRQPACAIKIAVGEEQARRLRREFENLTLLHDHLTDLALLSSIPSPLALEERTHLVRAVYSYVPGRSLASALSYPRRQDRVPQVLSRVADWLVAFQVAATGQATIRGNGHKQLADLLAAIDDAESRPQESLPLGSDSGLTTAQKAPGARGLRHGDLKPEHILWRDSSIGVLDWGEMKPGGVTSDWFYFLTLSALQMGGVESVQQLALAAPTLEAIFFSRHWFGELAMQTTHRLLDRLNLPTSAAAALFVLSVCRDSRYRWPYLAHEPFGAYNDVLRLLRRRWGDLVFNRAAA